MAQLAEYNETSQGAPRKHSSLLVRTADGPCFETQILETLIQGAPKSVVMDLHIISVAKMALSQNITHFAPWKLRFLKMCNQTKNFKEHSICPILGLLVLSQIPARNWLGFWKEGIKDCGGS